MNKKLSLFLTFFKIGAFTFGGGYAMIPIIQNEIVENKKWISDDDMLEIIAISESTPGPLAINSATFVGYKVAGFWGAVLATAGVVIPSFVIILLISGILNAFKDNRFVKSAFLGIRLGVLALLLKTLISMVLKAEKNAISYIIIIGAFLAAAFLKINAIFIIIASAVIGITFSGIQGRKKS